MHAYHPHLLNATTHSVEAFQKPICFEDDFARMGATTLGMMPLDGVPGSFGYPPLNLEGYKLPYVDIAALQYLAIKTQPKALANGFLATTHTFEREAVAQGQTQYHRTGVTVPPGTTLMLVMLAREAGAHVIGTGRALDRQKALDFGAQEFIDLDSDTLEDVGGVDVVFDVIGGEIGKRSARLIRTGGTLVSVVGPSEARPDDGRAIDFVVESDRAQLTEIVQRVRDGRLRTNIGTVSTLDDAIATFNSTKRRAGKTVISVRP